MFTICVTAFDKKDLPKWLAYEIERYHEQGHLTGLVHIKDDVIRETRCGCWEILSYWGTPEEVDAPGSREAALIKEAEEYLYTSDDLATLISIIWDLLHKHAQPDIEQFRNDVFVVLQGPDVIKNLLCVLIDWSDRVDVDG